MGIILLKRNQIMTVFLVFCVRFIMDIVQYKNKLKNIIDRMEYDYSNDNINYGFILPFNSTNDILPTSPIVTNLDENTMIIGTDNSDMIMDTTNKMFSDFGDFVNKYTNQATLT